MPATREEVLKSALELSEVDRMLLATELFESVSDDVPGWSIHDPRFEAELDRRMQDGLPTIPWETIKAKIESGRKS